MAEKPKELQLDERWERAIDLSVRRSVYGAASGGAAAFLLLKGTCPRIAVMTFGVGLGLGSALTDCREDLETMFGAPKVFASFPYWPK